MMKTLGKILVGIVVVAAIALTVLRVVGLNPKDRRAGLWLSGDVVTTLANDWSFTNAVQEIQVQTNSWSGLPHSITTQCVSVDGKLYIASFHFGGPNATRRLWNRNVNRDPRIRVKVGDKLYERKVIPLTDQTEIARVLEAYVAKYPSWAEVMKRPESERPMIYYWRTEPA